MLPAWNNMFAKDIEKHCDRKELKHFDIYNIYDTIFSSKYLVYHRLYCKKNFPFYHYLTDKYIPATHCHIFILSNTKVDFTHIDTVLQPYKHCLWTVSGLYCFKKIKESLLSVIFDILCLISFFLCSWRRRGDWNSQKACAWVWGERQELGCPRFSKDKGTGFVATETRDHPGQVHFAELQAVGL